MKELGTGDRLSLRERPLRIDEVESSGFLKEGHIKASNFKIAYDDIGRKYLLKTTVHFVNGNNQLMKPNELAEAKITPEEFFGICETEEKAWRLADFIGVPMAETQAVMVDGIPFSAYSYLEGARDCSWGDIRLVFSEQPEILANQELALALGALFKFIVNERDDGGQYLQDSKGDIYLSDIAVSAVNFKFDPPAGGMLTLILRKRSSSAGYFGTTLETVSHQLHAINSSQFQEILAKLSAVTAEQVLPLVSSDQATPSDEEKKIAALLVKRMNVAKEIFNYLVANAEEVAKAINPNLYLDSRFTTYVSEEQSQAIADHLIRKFMANNN